MIINQLSGGTFNEKPVEEKKLASQSWQRSRYLVSDGSESEAEPAGRIENKFYILSTKQGARIGSYGEIYAKCFEV
jgi:hypothetical protein